MNRIRLTTLFLIITALLPISSHAQFPPSPGTGPGLPETIEAIASARVTTRILYITAHPDDAGGVDGFDGFGQAGAGAGSGRELRARGYREKRGNDEEECR